MTTTRYPTGARVTITAGTLRGQSGEIVGQVGSMLAVRLADGRVRNVARSAVKRVQG